MEDGDREPIVRYEAARAGHIIMNVYEPVTVTIGIVMARVGGMLVHHPIAVVMRRYVLVRRMVLQWMDVNEHTRERPSGRFSRHREGWHDSEQNSARPNEGDTDSLVCAPQTHRDLSKAGGLARQLRPRSRACARA